MHTSYWSVKVWFFLKQTHLNQNILYGMFLKCAFEIYRKHIVGIAVIEDQYIEVIAHSAYHCGWDYMLGWDFGSH